jgi:hypothetical protein
MGLQSTLSHKPTHATGGTDALTPADIGAQPAGSYATLEEGKIPAAQLPSYVDDVLEHADVAALPGTGETGKIYVTLDTGKCFRWSGSAFIEISPSPGSTDSVAEGTSNLYFTAARALAATQDALDGKASTAQGAKADTSLQQGAYISAASLEVGSIAEGQTADLYVGLDGKVGIGTETPAEKLTVNGHIDILGGQVKNLGAPVDATDAATKGFVDTAVAGLTPAAIGAASATNSIRSLSAASTLQLSDAANTVSAASALAITIPLHATVAFPIGSQVLLVKTTAATVSIAAAAGVTLNAPGAATQIASQYGMAVLLKVGEDSWILGGDVI